MQLTARQREFARIAGWAVPISITLGAVFGHFQAQDGSVWGYIQGAVTAIPISCTILLLEFAVFSRTRSALARRMPFLLYFALRSSGYLAAILMGLAVSAWLLREFAESRPLIERGAIIFSLVLSLGFNLLFGVNDLLGQGVLFNFVAGRYRRPRVEERVLLFIDMESSTVIAERLGETGFLDFLNRFVADVTESIVAQRGAIHKYVGDEIIVTWPLAAGLRDGHCVRAKFWELRAATSLARLWREQGKTGRSCCSWSCRRCRCCSCVGNATSRLPPKPGRRRPMGDAQPPCGKQPKASDD